MALTQIKKASPNASTKAEEDVRRERNANNNRVRYASSRRIEEDREEMEDNARNLAQSTQSRFGAVSTPTHALAAFQQYADEFIKAKMKGISDFEMGTMIIDRDLTGDIEKLEAAAVLIYLKKVVNEELHLFGHAIIFADLSKQPESLFERVERGQTLRDTTTWADALDVDFINVIKGNFEYETKLTIASYINAGGTVVDYDQIPVERINSEKTFRSTDMDNLILAVMNGLDGVYAIETDDTTRDVKPDNCLDDSQFVADVNLQPTTSKLPNGQPLAEDFLIKISEVTDRRDRSRYEDDKRGRSIHRRNGSQNRAYGSVSGRIDFTYSEPRPVRGRVQVEDGACWIPEFIIAGFDVMTQQPSLTMFMHMILGVGVLKKDDLYLDAFDPRNVTQKSRNIGALQSEMIDLEKGDRLPPITFTQSTKPEVFGKFTRAAILEDMFGISIEVPTQSPLAGILMLFDWAVDYAIRRNDDRGEYANTLIINAMDTLTGGRFKELWDEKAAVMENVRAIVPNGFWIDGSQNKRDTREIGELFLLNMDNPNEALENARKWDDSFRIENQLEAAKIRYDLIVEIHGNNFTQTDNVSRVWFKPEFYQTALEALEDAKMDIVVNDRNYRGRGNERRRTDDSRYFSGRDLQDRYRRYSGRNSGGNGYQNDRRYGARRSWN